MKSETGYTAGKRLQIPCALETFGGKLHQKIDDSLREFKTGFFFRKEKDLRKKKLKKAYENLVPRICKFKYLLLNM